MAKTETIQKPSKQSSKIYRFYIGNGAVAANGIPSITASYCKDDLFYVEDGKIKSRYSGIVQISVHIAGQTDQSASAQRLWYQVYGGNIVPQVILYGGYCSGDNVQIAEIDTSFSCYVKFIQEFFIGQGSLGISYIFITILD